MDATKLKPILQSLQMPIDYTSTAHVLVGLFKGVVSPEVLRMILFDFHISLTNDIPLSLS
jgi:hypothetical protein